MAENEIEPPLLGVAWDGTGYGIDGTIWGGEFFLVEEDSCRRAAHFRTFRLPGGEAAVKEPRRSALGLLHEILGDELWERGRSACAISPAAELRTLRSMLTQARLNSPVTSSAGRLFDAVASLIGLRTRSTFEGQAAMELEFAVDRPGSKKAIRSSVTGGQPLVIDWEPAIRAHPGGSPSARRSRRDRGTFHNMLADMIVAVARRFDKSKVVLSGGCFQNRYLTERAIHQLLTAQAFSPTGTNASRPTMVESRSARFGCATQPDLRELTMNLVYGEIIEVFLGGRHARREDAGARSDQKIPLGLLTDAVRGDRVLICDGVAISKVAAPERNGGEICVWRFPVSSSRSAPMRMACGWARRTSAGSSSRSASNTRRRSKPAITFSSTSASPSARWMRRKRPAPIRRSKRMEQLRSWKSRMS